MAHDVFISYSSDDKTVADAVCAKLESQRVRCWIAPRDVPPGESWAASIIDAISGSKVLVLVFSDGSNKSKQVVREVGEAVDKGIPIVPLRIEDVEPSREMRYYIKSIHWLDAMTPPFEQHLAHLTNRIQALLSVEKDEIPPVELVHEEEAPLRDRWPIPNWALVLFGFAAVMIVGGGIWFASTGLGSTPESSEHTSIAEVSDVPTGQPSEVIATREYGEWRNLSFHIPSETFWRQTGESNYTIIANPSSDTIAWSDEIISDDFTFSAEISHTTRNGAAMIIVYGDGIDMSYGCLIFHFGSLTSGEGWAGIEAHSIYEEADLLVANFGDFYIYEAARAITIEIVDRKASLYVDDQLVAFTFLPPEINHEGRIGILHHWEQPVGVTYSNIKIKNLGDEK